MRIKFSILITALSLRCQNVIFMIFSFSVRTIHSTCSKFIIIVFIFFFRYNTCIRLRLVIIRLMGVLDNICLRQIIIFQIGSRELVAEKNDRPTPSSPDDESRTKTLCVESPRESTNKTFEEARSHSAGKILLGNG